MVVAPNHLVGNNEHTVISVFDRPWSKANLGSSGRVIKRCQPVGPGQATVVVVHVESYLAEEECAGASADRERHAWTVYVRRFHAPAVNRSFQEKGFARFQVEFHGRSRHGKKGRKGKVGA